MRLFKARHIYFYNSMTGKSNSLLEKRYRKWASLLTETLLSKELGLNGNNE